MTQYIRDDPIWRAYFFKRVEATDYNGMSQEVSKSLGSVGYNPNILTIYN